MPATREQIRQAIDALRGRFIDRLRDDHAALVAARRSLVSEPARHDATREEIRALAHRLGGAGGVYGFNELSLAAQRLEVIAGRGGDEAALLRSSDELIGDLYAILAKAPAPAQGGAPEPDALRRP